mmetsp:Transcript_30433/g.29800  ORF Transcript_30433/g.29800 Transcript_30433/m.29800 type:complete len:195 (-) Transcript_30433:4445-5029(-)
MALLLDEQEHGQVNDELMYSLMDNNDNMYGYSTNENQRFLLKGLNCESNFICDIRKTSDNGVMYLTRTNKSSNIQVNFLDDPMEGKGDPYVTNVQEISEIQYMYPMVIYCKGNKEIYIHSYFHQNILMCLELDDMFLCFVEASPSFHITKHYFTQNLAIFFLTQLKDNIFLNVVEIDIYKHPIQFRHYKQKHQI